MALQLSNATKGKCLSNVFRPNTLYVMIPTIDGAGPSTDLPGTEINFSQPTLGQISLAGEGVHLTVQEGTTINAVYLHTSRLTKADVDQALVRIDLTGDDVEFYENNGIYIINTINVAINT